MEKATTIDILTRQANEGSFWLFLIKVYPMFDTLRGDPRFQELFKRFDPLRDDPRFQAMLRRVGFPE